MMMMMEHHDHCHQCHYVVAVVVRSMVQHYHVRHEVVADHDSHVPRLVLGVVTVVVVFVVG